MKKNSKYSALTKVDTSNYDRILLTEVLPYEVPILLTNEGFHKNHKSCSDSEIIRLITAPDKDRKPFSYKVVKNKDSYRTLQLMHPASQLSFINFYKHNHDLICGLTSNSETSLRAPYEISSWYYDPTLKIKNNALKDEGSEAQAENSSGEQFKYASSFFTYKKYNFLYKFYDSYEFHRIEKKFKKLSKFDIAKCFDSISTKRLGEAIKGEVFQKENRTAHNFENHFALLMEQANFGRTNGIIIGPEISRIFAEIVLQKIDRNVNEKNSSIKNLFELKRYVDDYFLFYNDDEVEKKIFSSIESELENFKLYLNESKKSRSTSPFLTGITMAKKDIQDIFSALFDSFDKTKSLTNNSETDDHADDNDEPPDEQIKFIRYFKSPGVVANRLIRDIKAIVKRNEIDFESITGYFFTVVKNKVYEIFNHPKELSPQEQENLFKFLKVIIDISFFVYSMDVRVRSTYLISQIAIMCGRIAKKLSQEYTEEISKRIQDEISLIVRVKRIDTTSSGVEVVNLVIALREISGEEDLISSDDILAFLTGNKKETLNYFQIIAILFYAKNNPLNDDLKKSIRRIISEKISNEKPSTHSESAHLLLDALSCPYLDLHYKHYLIRLTYNTERLSPPTQKQVKRELKTTTKHDWFTDWSEEGLKIERLLHKKELKTPYS